MDKYFKDAWIERLNDRVEGMNIGDLLRIQRTVDNLSLTDFANITGIDRSTVCKIQNRKRTMTPINYQAIISYLEGNFNDEIKALKNNQ